MLGLALNSKKLKDRLMDSGALISEVNMEYARTMNKIIFDEAQRRGGSLGSSAPLVQLAEAFPVLAPRSVPEKATLTIDGFDFPQQFSEFSFRTLLTKVSLNRYGRHGCFSLPKGNSSDARGGGQVEKSSGWTT